ncbi:MAG: TOBE domain-containing protein [Actinomycetota bacterium]|nr:TOBE domain-containing protein [Actinomycetota bacterium]
MGFSARNQMKGTVTSVKKAGVMAEVVVSVEGRNEIVAAITAGSADNLNLSAGQEVTVIIKATEVMVATG